jgi:uncharacterized protein YjbI with pentapeptide repeats
MLNEIQCCKAELEDNPLENGVVSMANQEHLNILKQGIERWNTWRREQTHVNPDLSWTNLSKADFSWANLRVCYKITFRITAGRCKSPTRETQESFLAKMSKTLINSESEE